MIVPNKVISLSDSALAMAPMIIECGPMPISLKELYSRVGPEFNDADAFLLTLDLLFAIGRLDVDQESGMVIYAD